MRPGRPVIDMESILEAGIVDVDPYVTGKLVAQILFHGGERMVAVRGCPPTKQAREQ